MLRFKAGDRRRIEKLIQQAQALIDEARSQLNDDEPVAEMAKKSVGWIDGFIESDDIEAQRDHLRKTDGGWPNGKFDDWVGPLNKV